jgi:hypothetical protein
MHGHFIPFHQNVNIDYCQLLQSHGIALIYAFEIVILISHYDYLGKLIEQITQALFQGEKTHLVPFCFSN